MVYFAIMPNEYLKQMAAFKRRRLKAFQMKKRGFTYREIGEALNCTPQRAMQLVAQVKADASRA